MSWKRISGGRVNMRARILIIDEVSEVNALFCRLLERQGYEVVVAHRGAEGMRLIEHETPHLVLLDLDLPGISGKKICSFLRSEPTTRHVPILMTTRRDGDGLEAKCLDGGADGFLAKPFDSKKMLAHVRALLRRSLDLAPKGQVLEVGPLHLEPMTRKVLFNGRPVPAFSPKEFGLLKCLVAQAPQVISKDALALQVWNTAHSGINPRTLDVHFRRIRQKLGPRAALWLRTVPRVGFQWISPQAAA